MLRLHIDHFLETRSCVQDLQRGTIRRRQWQSWKAHEKVEEMATATVRMGEYVQTMDREAAAVVFAEVIAILIAIAIVT